VPNSFILQARRLAAAVLLAGSLAAPAVAGPLLPLPLPSAGQVEPAPVRVAQNQQQAAQLAVRIQQLEEQIRLLTGQVEGLQFQLTQMQVLLEKQAADYEFRFQELEGGAGGKPQAATESGGAMPTAELPQDPAILPPVDSGALDAPLLSAEDAPMHDLGDSRDPLLGTGAGADGAPLGTMAEGDLANLGGGRPLDLSLDGGTPVNGDAAAQYQAGYDAIVRGDYAFAEDQFRQFIELYPTDPQAADATNWLGEALLQRGAYDEAADVLLTGFQSFPDSPRSADLLLKLGVALAGAGEVATACRTFTEVERRYPQSSPAFQTRLADERARAQCPA